MINLYTREQIRELERRAVAEFHLSSDLLMQRAGEAAFTLLRRCWPEAKRLTVVCGPGNNGGDGWVVARLAQEAQLKVTVVVVSAAPPAVAVAAAAAAYLRTAGVECTSALEAIAAPTDLLVDALFDIGINRAVSGHWRAVIEAINGAAAPVLALDIPSGLSSDSGRPLGCAVNADRTITFIGHKQGFYTGLGRDYCGEIHLATLDLPAELYRSLTITTQLLHYEDAVAWLPQRLASAHKGDHGHVLVVGGDHGMLGAVRIAGEAALRVGAGLVSVATRRDHAALIAAHCPELMCHGVERATELTPLLARATVVVIGPGLGRSAWGQALLTALFATALPLIVDADGLNLLAQNPCIRDNWIITPHPGEAGRLLQMEAAAVEGDRFAAVMRLAQRYGGVAVLKGAGTLVKGCTGPLSVCGHGNPGMAVAGMGDLLSGVLGGLVAQGMALHPAALTGVLLHSAAADRVAQKGMKGILASDLLPVVRELVNR